MLHPLPQPPVIRWFREGCSQWALRFPLSSFWRNIRRWWSVSAGFQPFKSVGIIALISFATLAQGAFAQEVAEPQSDLFLPVASGEEIDLPPLFEFEPLDDFGEPPIDLEAEPEPESSVSEPSGIFVDREVLPPAVKRNTPALEEDIDAPIILETAPAETYASATPVRPPISSESFTLNNSFRSGANRLQFLGEGRISIGLGVSFIYDSNPGTLSDQREMTFTREVTTSVPPTAEAIAAGMTEPTTQTETISETRLVDEDIEGLSSLTTDFSLGYRGGVISGQGFYFELLYGLSYYSDDRSAGSSSPFDHAFSATAGVRGAFTEISAFAGISQDSGNGFSVGSLNREAPQAETVTYNAGFNIQRRLASGSLEFGGAYQTQDLDDGDSDSSESRLSTSGQSQYSLDAAWFYDPVFLGYTTFGPGVTYTEEEVDGGQNQTSVSPTFRARWSPTALIQVGGYVGTDIRSVDGEGGSGSDTTPVYGIDGSWNAREGTSISAGINRSVEQSISEVDQNAVTTTVSVGLSQQLGGGRSASIDYRFEFADFEGTSDATSSASREDNFHQLGATLTQSFAFERIPPGTVSLFYNYNRNASDDVLEEYSQHIVGVRVGLQF